MEKNIDEIEQKLAAACEQISTLERSILMLNTRIEIDHFVLAALLAGNSSPATVRELWRQMSSEWLASSEVHRYRNDPRGTGAVEEMNRRTKFWNELLNKICSH